MKIRTPFEQKIYDAAYKAAYEKYTAIKGGDGSGNFGHAGRPGEVGGSSSDGGGVTVYHGTVSQLAGKIRKEGIKRSKASKVSKKGRVYFTTDIESAKYWAEDKVGMLGLDPNTTQLVVFEIVVPANILLQDTQSQGPNDFEYEGDIPPEWIVGDQIVDYYKSTKSSFYVPVLFSDGKMYL